MFNFKKIFKKKDSGESLSTYGVLLLMVIVSFVLIIFFARWSSNIENRNKVDMIARQYILKMETTGGLTDSDKIKLQSELSKYCDLDANWLDGTTLIGDGSGKADYGEDIYLCIKANLKIYDMSIKKDGGRFIEVTQSPDNNSKLSLSSTQKNNVIPIVINKSSTAKH